MQASLFLKEIISTIGKIIPKHVEANIKKPVREPVFKMASVTRNKIRIIINKNIHEAVPVYLGSTSPEDGTLHDFKNTNPLPQIPLGTRMADKTNKS